MRRNGDPQLSYRGNAKELQSINEHAEEIGKWLEADLPAIFDDKGIHAGHVGAVRDENAKRRLIDAYYCRRFGRELFSYFTFIAQERFAHCRELIIGKFQQTGQA